MAPSNRASSSNFQMGYAKPPSQVLMMAFAPRSLCRKSLTPNRCLFISGHMSRGHILQPPSVFELLAFEDVDLFGVLVHSSWKRKKKSPDHWFSQCASKTGVGGTSTTFQQPLRNANFLLPPYLSRNSLRVMQFLLASGCFC